jgi:RimJ/RimL family protein N-acetyltransferase
MILNPLSPSDCERVRLWRNKSLAMLRTPFLLTEEMQADFYKNVVCNRNANARYWGIWDKATVIKPREAWSSFDDKKHTTAGVALIGMCGLENISWENRNAEISIIIDPDQQRKGYGAQAVALLLDQGFNYLNLENIFGECYTCNPAVEFWYRICKEYDVEKIYLPQRKYWQGKYYSSLYFNINKGAYNENTVSQPT